MISNLDLKSNFDFLSVEHCNEFGVANYDTTDIHDPFVSYINAAMPRAFEKDNLADISLLMDGKDIRTDSIRVNS